LSRECFGNIAPNASRLKRRSYGKGLQITSS
jgi:hypothetical protein